MHPYTLCLMVWCFAFASNAGADEWLMPGKLYPLYDDVHSWRYDNASSSPTLSVVNSGTGAIVATADLSGCQFCRGLEDNCQANGIFPLPAPSILNGVTLGAVCRWGAHSQKFVQLGQSRNSELVGNYWIDVTSTDVGVAVSGDGLGSAEETLLYPAGTTHNSLGDGHRPHTLASPDAPPAEVTGLIRELNTLIRNRDSRALRAMLHPQVTFSFADTPGIPGFFDYWTLDADPENSAVWTALEALLEHSPAISADRSGVVLPYYTADWPEALAPWKFLVIAPTGVTLVAGPSASAPVVRELPEGTLVSRQPMPITGASGDWHYVQTHDGAFGYLPENAARSPLDLRLGLTNESGAWKIIYLVAGD